LYNYAAKNGMTTPVFIRQKTCLHFFNVQCIPVTFIFDEKGNLVNRFEGGDEYDTE
jgi:hypothetical protein